MTTARPTEIENPLHRLTDEQIERIGEEFQAIHDEVFDDLGERDADLHPQHHPVPSPARGALADRADGLQYKPAWALGTAGLSAAKIIENMEIGHNVMHGQWDWMNDPYIHSSTWDWDTASPASAWKHSHNYVHHTFTNVDRQGPRRRLRDHARRPEPEVVPVLPRPAVLQRAADGVLRVGRRRPRPRLRGDQDRHASRRSRSSTSSSRSAARRAARSSRTTSPSRR